MLCYPYSQSFRYGCLAHSGFADEHRVVFRSPVEYLQYTVYFPVSAYDPVDLVISCQISQIGTVHLQMRFLFKALLFLGLRAGIPFGVLPIRKCPRLRSFIAFIASGKSAAEKTQQRIGLAGIIGSFGPGTVFRFHLYVFKKAAHLLVDVVDVIISHARLLDQLVDGLDPLFFCAGQTKTFLYMLAVYYFCYKNYCVVFLAYRTNFHIVQLPSCCHATIHIELHCLFRAMFRLHLIY